MRVCACARVCVGVRARFVSLCLSPGGGAPNSLLCRQPWGGSQKGSRTRLRRSDYVFYSEHTAGGAPGTRAFGGILFVKRGKRTRVHGLSNGQLWPRSEVLMRLGRVLFWDCVLSSLPPEQEAVGSLSVSSVVTVWSVFPRSVTAETLGRSPATMATRRRSHVSLRQDQNSDLRFLRLVLPWDSLQAGFPHA